jgi:hypothetical protein
MFYIGEPPGEWESRDVQERAAQQIMYTLTRSADHFRTLRCDSDDRFDAYINKKLKLRSSNRIRSNVPSGFASEIVDTFHADIMTKIFRTKPLVKWRRRPGRDPLSAVAVEELIQWNYDMMPVWESVDPAVWQVLVYGSGPAKVLWENRTVNVPIPGVSGDSGSPAFEAVLSYRGPVIQSIYFYDVYPDPDKEKIDDRAPICSVHWRDFSELKALEYPNGPYINVDEVREIDILASDEKYQGLMTVLGDRVRQSEQRSKLGFSTDSRLDKAGVMVIEWDGYFRPKADWQDGRGRVHKGSDPIRSILTMANGKIIRSSPSPFASGENPWIWAKMGSIPGQLYGVGLIQKSKPQVHVVDVTMNVALQNLGQTVNRPKVIKESNIESAMTYDEMPGGIIRAKPNARIDDVIHPITQQSLGNDIWRMLEFAKERAQGVPGSSDLKAGRMASGDSTATEINTVFQQASQKFEYAMMWIDNSLILASAKKMYQLNQQFLDPEVVSRLLGATGQYFPKVTVRDLAMNPDFVAMASQKTASSNMMTANLSNGIRIISGVAAPWTIPVLKKLVLELFAEWRLPDLEELAAMMEQMEQEQPMVPEGAEGTEFSGTQGARQPSPTGTGRQDRRMGAPVSQRGLAKALGGILSNQA